MQTTTTVLREISFQLTQGNPWWGMLLANEYISECNPLRAPLVHQFKHRIGSALTGRGTLANKLIRGTRSGQLSASQLAAVGARHVRKDQTLRKNTGFRALTSIIGVNNPIKAAHRMAVRQRNPHVARYCSRTSRSAAIVIRKSPCQ